MGECRDKKGEVGECRDKKGKVGEYRDKAVIVSLKDPPAQRQIQMQTLSDSH